MISSSSISSSSSSSSSSIVTCLFIAHMIGIVQAAPAPAGRPVGRTACRPDGLSTYMHIDIHIYIYIYTHM